MTPIDSAHEAPPSVQVRGEATDEGGDPRWRLTKLTRLKTYDALLNRLAAFCSPNLKELELEFTQKPLGATMIVLMQWRKLEKLEWAHCHKLRGIHLYRIIKYHDCLSHVVLKQANCLDDDDVELAFFDVHSSASKERGGRALSQGAPMPRKKGGRKEECVEVNEEGENREKGKPKHPGTKEKEGPKIFFKQLLSISLIDCGRITLRGIKTLIREGKTLERLEIVNCVNVRCTTEQMRDLLRLYGRRDLELVYKPH
eukprot:CAMPEP_0175046010 /NCGR_PEP_ID=MMETSP0052_2-20121109/4784_1 /TAXON_ID=51329 ORGANISM="Polytomella parva, Strain SAG 63-3" /NCGR_SAMPLE_ID=MMETSP0052_2 /ASSEMBLY_ACC=CAM_ASM_000194 /LENGTH=255 /DNA_ID=CAMNT_0016309691 /DNA_START=1 /DNA_END=768 /DNA_ORIENTATION=+